MNALLNFSRHTVFFVLLAALGWSTSSAQLPVQDWREHLPYRQTIDVAYGNNTAWCATPFAVFGFNTTDNSVQRISKANLLSGADLSAIAFDNESGSLLVGYVSGVLDIITHGNPFSLPDIAQSTILGDKQIYDIFLADGKAYLGCGFGVVVIDIARREVSETWYIDGQNNLLQINSIQRSASHWYLATNNGVYRAEVNNPFLVSFEAWELIDDLPLDNANYSKLIVQNNTMLLVRENGAEDELWHAEIDTWNWALVPTFESTPIFDIAPGPNAFLVAGFNQIFEVDYTFNILSARFGVNNLPVRPNAAIYDTSGRVWIASGENGLMTYGNNWPDQVIAPSGPRSFNAFRLDAYNEHLWIASGGVDLSWTNKYELNGFYGLVEGNWWSVSDNPGLNELNGIRDIMAVAIDPEENTRVYFGSWEEGLIEVNNGQVTNIFNQDNSTLQTASFGGGQFIGVAGVDFDEDGNLWFSNAYTSNGQLQVRKSDGSFRAFNFQPQLNATVFMGEVLATREGYIWGILPRGNGLVVFDHAGTIDDPSDDSYRVLTNQPGQGGLPNMDIYAVEEDLNGEIWVGTLQGIAVFYAPQAIFSEEGNFDAQQILIEQDGNIQILLETEQINCITIDGANRKWIGTASSGVFLLSQNGQEQIHHFTTRNSPLLSNNVLDIAINYATGETFFATDRGVVSYMSTATNFDQDMASVRVFPNPVRADFEGLISIDGLAFDSDVKITDTSGNIVHATRSNGGRAVWDGNGRDGRRVATGIYLVFCSSPDGEAANVGKIAIIR